MPKKTWEGLNNSKRQFEMYVPSNNPDYLWIVNIDLEKFFDNVPQDKLMSYVGRVIHDGDTESLIRKYLKAGVMNRGKYESTKIGTPQGGNLSPLLKLGVPKWLAHKVANWGDHYQFVATKSVLARAVSKEKLTKRGLVSLSYSSFMVASLTLSTSFLEG